jgi:hypothetical protein
MKGENQNIKLKSLPEGTISAWETSESNNLKKIGEYQYNGVLTVTPKSVTTFVLNY